MKNLIAALIALAGFQSAASNSSCATIEGQAKLIADYKGPVPSCGPICAENYILNAVCPEIARAQKNRERELVQAVTSPQIAEKMAQFRDLVYLLTKVEVNGNKIKLQGNIGEDDTPCGTAELEIQTTTSNWGATLLLGTIAQLKVDRIPNCPN